MATCNSKRYLHLVGCQHNVLLCPFTLSILLLHAPSSISDMLLYAHMPTIAHSSLLLRRKSHLPQGTFQQISSCCMGPLISANLMGTAIVPATVAGRFFGSHKFNVLNYLDIGTGLSVTWGLLFRPIFFGLLTYSYFRLHPKNQSATAYVVTVL